HRCQLESSFRKSVNGARMVAMPMLAIMAIMLLSGCATMSPEQCLTADWSQRGYKDGRAGFTSNRVAKHHKACSKVGVIPNLAAYRKGYERGLAQYCTPANAVEQGRNGK